MTTLKKSGRARLQFNSEAERKAHRKQLDQAYLKRKQAKGYQRATIFLPGHLLEQLRIEARQKASSLQDLIAEKLENEQKNGKTRI
jgi:hypothetical protein